jgi:hypothetical protein
MLIRETDVDERLDMLENVQDGEVFMYDGKTSRNRFHNKTVAKIMQNKEMKHALIVFLETVPRQRAEQIATRIGNTIERLQRPIEIDIFFEIPCELYDMILAECDIQR